MRVKKIAYTFVPINQKQYRMSRQTLKPLAPVVFEMTNAGKGLSEIANKLNLTKKQVSNIKTLYKGQFATSEFEKNSQRAKKAWVKRKSNEQKPRLINLNGLEIEIHNSMIKRVIISEKNTIKIF